MSTQPAVRLEDIVSELGVSTAGELSRLETLPVDSALRNVFPQGIRRGSTLGVTSTSLMLLLLSASTQAGSWAAIAGHPNIGVAAAQELGVALQRCAFVPHYNANSAPKVVAALIDAVDLVVVHRADDISSADARRLIARARERKCVLVLSKTSWANVTPLTLRVTSATWHRTANGLGRLQGRWVDVSVTGRGSMGKSLQTAVWIGDQKVEKPQKTVPFRPKVVS